MHVLTAEVNFVCPI